jgi:hypothetical protein
MNESRDRISVNSIGKNGIRRVCYSVTSELVDKILRYEPRRESMSMHQTFQRFSAKARWVAQRRSALLQG